MKEKREAQAVENTIKEIGDNKTTDKKIVAACKRHGSDEARVRKIAGFDKDGINEYKITRTWSQKQAR